MENLNLDYNIKSLIKKALSKHKTEGMQAEALGITTRTLYSYRKRYNLPINEQKNRDWYNKNKKSKNGYTGSNKQD